MNSDQEPKYAITAFGQLVNRASGSVIPDDEPVFILRARDKNAALALAYYKKLCSDDIRQAAVNDRLHHFVNYAHEHPERMKEPDSESVRNEPTDKEPNQDEIISRGAGAFHSMYRILKNHENVSTENEFWKKIQCHILFSMGKTDPDGLKQALEQRKLVAWFRSGIERLNPETIGLDVKTIMPTKIEFQSIQDSDVEAVKFYDNLGDITQLNFETAIDKEVT